MNIALWIVTALLALVFLAAGAMKLTQSQAKLAASGQGWVEGYSAGAVKGIGAVEVAGALGLVLPGMLGIAPVLVGWAAVGIVVLMIGAGITHARRGEYPNVGVNLVLAVLAAAVAVARFGPYAF